MNLRSIYIAFAIAFLYTTVNSQTIVIDRLKMNIQKAGTDDEKLQNILSLCDQGYSLHPDTLMAYAEKAKKIAHQKNNLHDETEALYYQSYALTNKGLIDSSLVLANECLEILQDKVKDIVLMANVLNQKGRCYMRKNQYKEAIDMGYKVIDASEKAKDTLLQMKGKTLIGWAYLEMGQTKEALVWHLKALQTTNNTVLHEKYSILFANLAINYNGLERTDSALYFITRAIKYSRKYQNLFALSNSLAIQAEIYVRSGQGKLAEAPLKEVVAIRKLIGDPFYIVSDMSQLGLYYAHNGQPEKGIAICNEGIDIANEYKIDTKLFFLYGTLAENYKAAGNTAKYAEVLEKIISLKDSVYQKNSAAALAEMQTKYDLQKKENTIIQQKLDITKKSYLFYGAILLSVLVFLSGYLMFKNYRRKQQMKMQLALELGKRQAEKAVTEAEEKERKRIAADLHDNLGAYAASIASNLDNISVKKEDHDNVIALQELRNNSQSIVSQLNDTIWILKRDSLSLTAISDRLKVFIQRIQSSYPEIKMEIMEEIMADHLLPPSQAFHLFQIVKEGINNALRHSGCRQVLVLIEGYEIWKICIVDDGKGFSTQLNGDGNGLYNMQARSKEAGWKIKWEQNKHSGTTVVIESAAN